MNGTEQRTTITDIDIPFTRLIGFFVKVAFAAIPAAIIVSFAIMLLMMLLGLLFGFGTWGWWGFWDYWGSRV